MAQRTLAQLWGGTPSPKTPKFWCDVCQKGFSSRQAQSSHKAYKHQKEVEDEPTPRRLMFDLGDTEAPPFGNRCTQCA